MKIGFIGCGNMASAMIGGIIKNQVVAPADILASAKTEVSREKKKEELGIVITADNREVAAFAEVLILAVKPFYYEDVFKEIRDVVSKAKEELSYYQRRTIVFIDEIHRFNKGQQDVLLPYVEDGTFILIGATTENPYFEINGPLLSRLRLIHLKRLTDEAIDSVLHRALDDEKFGLAIHRYTA